MTDHRIDAPIRQGSVLIVMMGISLILVGLILTMSVKTQKSLNDSALIAKHAQAHLMLQGALMYLSAQYPGVAALPLNKNCWDSSNKAPESPPGSNRISGASITGGVCTTLANSSNFNYAPIASAGWYYITWDASASRYFIVAAGGASQGRTIASKKPYEVCYYLTYNPTKAAGTYGTLSAPTWPSTTGSPAWPTSDPKLWP